MILIGQYDSPFVRRVGIALTLYKIAYEHRPWSAFSDAEKIRALNPLVRVPTLALDDGTVLFDTASMLDHLDSLAPQGEALCPAHEPERHQALRIAALAGGLADKAVSLFYERRLHKEISQIWEERCRGQVLGALALLEKERAARPGGYWFGGRISHADIAAAASLRFADEAFPGMIDWAANPALKGHCAAMEALPVFRQIQQKFIPPA